MGVLTEAVLTGYKSRLKPGVVLTAQPCLENKFSYDVAQFILISTQTQTSVTVEILVIKEPARTRLEAIIARATVDGLVQIVTKVKKNIYIYIYIYVELVTRSALFCLRPYNILLKNPCSFCPVCLTSTQVALLDIYLYKLMLQILYKNIHATQVSSIHFKT